MGSIVEYIDCPNCTNNEAHCEFWYKSGEEHIFCDKCGYSKKAFIKNRDKSLNELTDDDWDMAEVKNPYGVFKAFTKGNPSWICGTLETEKDLEELKLKIIDQDIKVDKLIVSRFIDGEIKETILIGVS